MNLADFEDVNDQGCAPKPESQARLIRTVLNVTIYSGHKGTEMLH